MTDGESVRRGKGGLLTRGPGAVGREVGRADRRTRNAVYSLTAAPQIAEDISVAPKMTDELAPVR